MSENIVDVRLSDFKRAKAAAARAIEKGESLYLVTSKDDEAAFERRWGRVAVYVPQFRAKKRIGVPAHRIAQAVDGVCGVVIVRNPEEMSLGRLGMLADSLCEVSNMIPGQTLRALQAPPLSLCEPADQREQWEADDEFRIAKIGVLTSDGCSDFDDLGENFSEINVHAVERIEYSSHREAAVREMNRSWAVVSIEGKTRILHETADAQGHSKVELFSRNEAKSFLENECYVDEAAERKQVFGPWMTSQFRRSYKGCVFAPDVAPEVWPKASVVSRVKPWVWYLPDPGYYNLYKGYRFPVPDKSSGAYTVFLEHLEQNICRGDRDQSRWLWAWMCNLIREPAKRPGTAIVLRGEQGVGKSIVGEVLGRLLHPDHYIQVLNKEHLVGRFNGHLGDKLLVQAEEATWAGDKQAAGILKALVTQDICLVERKGIDAFPVHNYARLIMTSNHDWVVPAGLEERRFAVFDVGNTRMQDREFFGGMLRQLERGGDEDLLYDLLHDDLESYPDPSVIPNTKALREQKIHSLDTVGRWWHARLCAEHILEHVLGWPGEVGCDQVYEAYLRDTRAIQKGRAVSIGEFGKRLRQLCPEIDRVRRREGDSRPYVYTFPPLRVCREALERMVGGSVNWS